MKWNKSELCYIAQPFEHEDFSIPCRMVRRAAEGLLPFHQPSLFFPVNKVKNSEAIIVNDLCVHELQIC